MEEDEVFYETFEELLFDSCRYGDMDDVIYALENKPDIKYTDSHKNTSLHMASANGHLPCLNLLFDYSTSNNLPLLFNA